MKRKIAVVVTTSKQKLLVEVFCEAENREVALEEYAELVSCREGKIAEQYKRQGIKVSKYEPLNINVTEKKLTEELNIQLDSCVIFDDGSSDDSFITDWDLSEEYLEEKHCKEAIKSLKSCELMTFQEFVSKFELEGVA